MTIKNENILSISANERDIEQISSFHYTCVTPSGSRPMDVYFLGRILYPNTKNLIETLNNKKLRCINILTKPKQVINNVLFDLGCRVLKKSVTPWSV